MNKVSSPASSKSMIEVKKVAEATRRSPVAAMCPSVVARSVPPMQ